jgi:hypothetical protein
MYFIGGVGYGRGRVGGVFDLHVANGGDGRIGTLVGIGGCHYAWADRRSGRARGCEGSGDG